MGGLNFQDRSGHTWQQQLKWDQALGLALKLGALSDDTLTQINSLLSTKVEGDPSKAFGSKTITSGERKKRISEAVQTDLLSRARAQMQSTGSGLGANSPLDSGGSLLARARA